MRQVLNIAHRGASGYAPENTVEAFLKAAGLGADMAEMDVHQTPDGKLIVAHDYPPETCKLSRIPTLKEIIQALRNKNIKLNIELKQGFKKYPLMEEKVLEILKKESVFEKTFVSSFEGNCIKRMRQLDSDIELGIIFTPSLRNRKTIDDALRLDVGVLITNKKFVTDSIINEIHKAGLKLYAYTINEPAHIRRMIAMGIDGIYTDYPDRLKKILTTQTQRHSKIIKPYLTTNKH